VIILIVDFFEIEAVVSAHLGIPTVTIVAPEDRVVGIYEVVAIRTRWNAISGEENKRTKPRGWAEHAPG
jgi:hypothetical protein